MARTQVLYQGVHKPTANRAENCSDNDECPNPILRLFVSAQPNPKVLKS